MSKHKSYVDIKENCMVLEYNTNDSKKNQYFIDFEQYNKISSFNKNFLLYENNNYPSYYYNYKHTTTLYYINHIIIRF